MEETPGKTGNGAPGVEDFTVLQPSFANVVTLWCATQVLKAAGFSVEDAARALNEVHGVEVPRETVEAWYASNEAPRFIRKACTRSYGLSSFVQLLRSGRLSKCLWALRYVAGAAIGDGDRSGRLRVRDWHFAYAYARALSIATGENVMVRRESNNSYCVGRNKLVKFIVNSGVWRILAYLDKFDKRRFFLAGLMDSEGSISPHVDRKAGNVKVQIWFTNTNAELVEYVEAALREIGLNPKRAPPKLSDISRINGKTAVRKKTLFRIYVIPHPSKLINFARRVGFRCLRKRKMLEFFILIATLPPQLRLKLFLNCWEKVDGKWKLKPKCRVKRKAPTLEKPKRRKEYVVECPVCQRPGIFKLHREVCDGKMLIQVHVQHENETCKLNLIEKEIVDERDQTLRITCTKCSRPGYIYVSSGRHRKGNRVYNYVHLGVSHKSNGKTKTCILMYIHLLET